MSTETPKFGGLRVAAFESRRADDMRRMIERFGGEAHVSPSMREVPLADNAAATDFAHRLMTGQIDVVILMTGVGLRHLVTQVERHVDRARFLTALGDAKTVARGPKPVAAMKELGLTPTHRVPEPNTWREVLTTLDAQVPLAGQVVGLQEYGQLNPSLMAGLEARGAQVISLKVYEWDLPEETGPLEENVRDRSRRDRRGPVHGRQPGGQSAQSGRGDRSRPAAPRGWAKWSLLRLARPRARCCATMNCRSTLNPSIPRWASLCRAPRQRPNRCSRGSVASRRRSPNGPSAGQLDTSAAWHESLFMKACRREPVERTPIWLMRQAGRYMAEYRAVRAKTTFLELCKNPQLCSEVMCTAVRRLGVDAAIIFSDLLPILEPMGMDLEFAQGEGPVIHNPVREVEDVDRVLELESVDALHFVIETVRQTRADLPAELPLIGFSGAPFTLASYAIEGGASRNYLYTKTLMYRDEGAWRALMDRFARAITKYLNAQIVAGAQAVQLFDSWVGCLGPDDYRRYVLPFVRAIIDEISPGVPVIHFGTGNPALLPLMAEAGGSVIGVDWRVRLDAAWERVGYDRAVQGNLDPAVLLADRDEIRRRAAEILEQAAGRPGHIFNLGHGVLQQTPVESVIALVDAVHELSSK